MISGQPIMTRYLKQLVNPYNPTLAKSPCDIDAILVISKIQLVVYHQCCILIGWATTGYML